MNNNDIFRKSDLGLAQIKDQSAGVLPREARTLLILIDGKKTYQRYLESLGKSKMFEEAGGIAPLFKMLRDLQYIELAVKDNTAAAEQKSAALPEPVNLPFPTEPQARTPLSNQESRAASVQSTQSTTSVEAEFQAQFNNPVSSQGSDKGSYSKRTESDVNYESLKSELATYIEKNAPSQDAWGYLLSLEQCENASQLLILAQDIQSSTTGGLSRGMEKFSKSLKRQI